MGGGGEAVGDRPAVALERPQTARTRPGRARLLITGSVFIVLLALALGLVYACVLKPENDRIQQTLQSTMDQSDRNAQASREADDAKADLQERRDLAFASLGGMKGEFIVKVTNNYRWTKTEAIRNDPIVSGALKVHPELEEPIRRWDTARITDITEKNTDAHFSARDKNYLRTFSNAIGGQKE